MLRMNYQVNYDISQTIRVIPSLKNVVQSESGLEIYIRIEIKKFRGVCQENLFYNDDPVMPIY